MPNVASREPMKSTAPMRPNVVPTSISDAWVSLDEGSRSRRGRWPQDVDRHLKRHERLITELFLLPLNRPEVEAMLQCILGTGGPLRTDVLHTLHALTEGNPFFVEEVVRTVIAGNDPPGEASALRVPRTVHDAVQRRV